MASTVRTAAGRLVPAAPASYTITALSPLLTLYTPTDSSPPASQHPSLILLCTWLSAHPKHIGKYLTAHTQLFPSSPILLAVSTGRSFSFPSASLYAPAAPYLTSDSRVLAHILSNGGAWTLLQLLRASDTPIRFDAAVFDSVPGTAHPVRASRAFATSIVAPSWRRWLSVVAVYVQFVGLGLLWMVLGRPNQITQVRRGLLEEVRTERRLYVYGPGDTVCEEKYVVGHVEEAEASGLNVKRLRVERTGHVGHMRGAGDEYWAAVEGAWTGRGWWDGQSGNGEEVERGRRRFR